MWVPIVIWLVSWEKPSGRGKYLQMVTVVLSSDLSFLSALVCFLSLRVVSKPDGLWPVN